MTDARCSSCIPNPSGGFAGQFEYSCRLKLGLEKPLEGFRGPSTEYAGWRRAQSWLDMGSAVLWRKPPPPAGTRHVVFVHQEKRSDGEPVPSRMRDLSRCTGKLSRNYRIFFSPVTVWTLTIPWRDGDGMVPPKPAIHASSLSVRYCWIQLLSDYSTMGLP